MQAQFHIADFASLVILAPISMYEVKIWLVGRG